MKKILFSLIVIFVCATLFARPVELDLAQQVATMKIEIEEQDVTIGDVFTIEDNENILAYVFHLNPQGYIAISTDTDITPVVSYSFRYNFVEQDIDLNIGYQMIKTDMTLRHQAIPHFTNEKLNRNNEIWSNYANSNYAAFNTRDEVWPPVGYSSTGGWIEVLYNQSAPYFSFCPIDPSTNSRSVTGCVATAMAMIMQYHHHIGDPVFTDSDDYTSTGTYPYVYIDNDHNTYDFPSFPELNVYIEDLKENIESWTPLTNENLAALSFAAGVSVDMDYASDGSGAQSSASYSAFLNKFDYTTANYTTNANTTFYNNLQNDMMNARPVYLGIYQTGAPYGHAIVADGYNESDNTYHLNFGWGGNTNGWYSLPQGMPGFNSVSAAVYNIEDEHVPFDIMGQAIVDAGVDVTDVYITLDGPRNYEGYVPNDSGYFSFEWVVEGNYTVTAIVELADGGYHYIQEEMYLDPNNDTVILFLDNYENLTADITSSTSPEGASVAIYDGDEIVTTGFSDASGNVSMPGILPGEYFAVASLNGNYFEAKDIVVTADNQNIDFSLYYSGDQYTFNFAGEPIGQFSLFANMSCGIRLAGDDLVAYENYAIAQVKFIAPFNPDQGQIFPQLWHDNVLISEHEITNFTDGDWVNVSFQNFGVIDPDEIYYVGYRISSTESTIPAAYHDAGPWVDGKGAYIKFSGWIPLPASSGDYNFCIKAVVIAENLSAEEMVIPGTISNLKNNYPNPFNPTTTISYYVQDDGIVKIEIYNIKGQRVKTLVNSYTKEGNHSVIWNGKDDNNIDVSSGMYLYKMKAGGEYTSTKKMIMMK